MAAHAGICKLAAPDYWNHRVLLFDLHADGSLAERRASALIGQQRFDVMEIGQGRTSFNSRLPARSIPTPSLSWSRMNTIIACCNSI
jgi:hypothetical protein